MEKKCYPQAKKMGKSIKKCHHVLQINNANLAYMLSHEFFTSSFKRYKGIIKYYDFPSFKDPSNNIFECYLGDLTKGFENLCRREKSYFNFYELPNGKFVIENSSKVSRYIGITQCVKGMVVPKLDMCDFDDEDQQYDIRIIKEGEDFNDEEGVFIENFGMFVEVVIIEEYEIDDFFNKYDDKIY